MTDEYEEDKEDADAADFGKSIHGVDEDGEPSEDESTDDELDGFRVEDEEEEDHSF